jgi:hypothetical protein
LPEREIAAGAKWVLHLDMVQLGKGKVGRYLLDEVLQPQALKLQATLRRELGFEFDLSKIESISAYGVGYELPNNPDGLLLIRTSMDVEQGLETAAKRDHPGLRVAKVESGKALYAVNDLAYVGIAPRGRVLVGKSREAIEQGQDVLAGRTPSLAKSASMPGYPETPFAFFFMAVAEGFGDQTMLPPNAAVLKQANGARIVLGETEGKIRVSLDIRAQSEQAARQIQQVAQGFIALATLNADADNELRQLAAGASVQATGGVVTLGVQLPVDRVIRKIEEKR